MKPLANCQIVELTSLACVRLAGRLLSDQGACVHSITSPEFCVASVPDVFFDFGKTCETSTSSVLYFSQLISQADMVIGLRPHINILMRIMPQAFSPEKIIIAFSATNTENETSDILLDEFSIGAQAGLFSVPFLPYKTDIHQIPVVHFLGGIYGALAATMALLARARSGIGDTFNVSLIGAALNAMSLQGLMSQNIVTRWKPLHWTSSPFQKLWKTKCGGFVFLHVGIARHLQKLLITLELNNYSQYATKLKKILSKQTLSDPIAIKTMYEAWAANRVLKHMFLQQKAVFWEQLLSNVGICCMMVRSYGEWTRHAHAQNSGIISPALNAKGERFLIPTGIIQTILHPTTFVAKNNHPWKLAVGAPLTGVKVLDFSQVIAGPIAGRTLAEFGAEVLRIDNPNAKEVFFDPFHSLYHAGKKSVGINLHTEQGKIDLWEVISAYKPDVVIQNFSYGIAKKLGIDEQSFRKVFPNICFLDINAFGQSGALRALPGFEQTAQALCGVAVDYGKNNPKLFRFPINDMGAGLLGAFGVTSCLFNYLRTGCGSSVHTSLAASASMLAAITPARNINNNPIPKTLPKINTFTKVIKQYIASKNPLIELITLASGETIPLIRAPINAGKIPTQPLVVKAEVSTYKANYYKIIKWTMSELKWLFFNLLKK